MHEIGHSSICRENPPETGLTSKVAGVSHGGWLAQYAYCTCTSALYRVHRVLVVVSLFINNSILR